MAKIAGVIHFQGYRKQFGRQCISGILTNLYGPNDNFDSETSHVLRALLHKFHNASMNNERVEIPGNSKKIIGYNQVKFSWMVSKK